MGLSMWFHPCVQLSSEEEFSQISILTLDATFSCLARYIYTRTYTSGTEVATSWGQTLPIVLMLLFHLFLGTRNGTREATFHRCFRNRRIADVPYIHTYVCVSIEKLQYFLPTFLSKRRLTYFSCSRFTVCVRRWVLRRAVLPVTSVYIRGQL